MYVEISSFFWGGMLKRQVSIVVKYLKGRNGLVMDSEGVVDVESDCEHDSPETEDVLLEEEQTRAVLTTGSFSACVRIFYPAVVSREMTSPPTAGNLFSSTFAQIRFRSPPSNPKASTLARITFAKGRWRWRPLLAHQRVYTFCRIW
jgi:hypothetical protein